jgi:hypothetical protein
MAPERTDDDVAAWRRAYRSTLAAEPAGCPGDDALAALATGELPEEERTRVADHVTRCPRCAQDYRLLAEVHAEAAVAPRRRRTPWLSIAAAAAVAMAAGVALRVGPPASAPDGLRGGEAVRAVTPAPDAKLAAAPAELAWGAEPGAQRYRVRLYDARAARLWESETAPATSRPLPPEVRARLVPGESYFWVVEAEGTGPARRLGPYWFQLTGGG